MRRQFSSGGAESAATLAGRGHANHWYACLPFCVPALTFAFSHMWYSSLPGHKERTCPALPASPARLTPPASPAPPPPSPRRCSPRPSPSPPTPTPPGAASSPVTPSSTTPGPPSSRTRAEAPPDRCSRWSPRPRPGRLQLPGQRRLVHGRRGRRRFRLRQGHRGHRLHQPVLRPAVRRQLRRRPDPGRLPLRPAQRLQRRHPGRLLRQQRRRLVGRRHDPAARPGHRVQPLRR